MTTDYKYTLTRICLRTGQLSLTQSLIGMLPKEGKITAIDAEKNTEIELELKGRNLTGVARFFQVHGLGVNDEIHIRPLEDGTFLFTPTKRDVRGQEAKAATGLRLAERLLQQAVPLAEREIRTQFPELTNGVDIHALLSQDARFSFKDGRWQPQSMLSQSPAPEQRQTEQITEQVTEIKLLKEEPLLNETPQTAIPDAKPSLNKPVLESESVTSYVRPPKLQKAGLNSASETESLDDHNRAKDFLRTFGFEVESLANGQLLAHADLGRHKYSAYIQVLSEGAQLDWATLLTRRRDTNASYAAVFADYRDLIRLGAPAGMARATLWSWDGLERVKDIMNVMPLSPYDLESHFKKDGLFEEGKERFQKEMNERVAQRGVFSTVLSRLAGMKAPCVFMLDDVADEQLSRETVLKVLENLSGAPFHMITRVDHGEFCLRQKVADSLQHISDYSLSLKSRLPNRQTERLQSLDDIVKTK